MKLDFVACNRDDAIKTTDDSQVAG